MLWMTYWSNTNVAGCALCSIANIYRINLDFYSILYFTITLMAQLSHWRGCSVYGGISLMWKQTTFREENARQQVVWAHGSLFQFHLQLALHTRLKYCIGQRHCVATDTCSLWFNPKHKSSRNWNWPSPIVIASELMYQTSSFIWTSLEVLEAGVGKQFAVKVDLKWKVYRIGYTPPPPAN